MGVLRTRRFRPGDERALNDAYLSCYRAWKPDAARSLEAMRSLWYDGPGGPIDSWLVEEETADGSWRVAGHHALSPRRFTLGGTDLLCAKIVNSFLLPEFRSRFLYLRFEQQCLAEVGSRYAAIYSYGSGVSRLRGPLGYAAGDVSIRLEHGSHHFDLATRALTRFVQHRRTGPWTQLASAWAQACARGAREPSFELVEYTSEQAIRSSFFTDFWSQARGEAGMSPRRDVADLAWRFWKRPGSSFVTLVHSWSGGERAYCIVDTANPYHYSVADFFVTPMRADLLDALLDALFAWSAGRGALTMSLWTTAAGQPAAFMDVLTRRMAPHPLTRFRRRSQFSCRITPGGAADLPQPGWNITELLLD
jgi:hypothetical protein